MKNKEGNRVVGLDLHPDVCCVAVLQGEDAANARVVKLHDRLNTAGLIDWAHANLSATDTVVMEASGNSFEIAGRLHDAGFMVKVLESAQASAVRDGFCNDDRHSAVKLARVYLSGLAHIVWQPDACTREHREIFFAHRNAVRDSTRARNRLHGWLNGRGVRIPKGLPLTQERGRDWVLAAASWSEPQRLLLNHLFEQLGQAESHRRELARIMAKEVASRPEWARLWRLLGVRHVVAFALMACIGDIRRFATAKKLVGYIGLAPRRVQSGEDAKGRTFGIPHKGRRDLRALLLQSAQNILRQRNSPLHRWGWRLVLRKSKAQAAVAVARKLTVSIWHLLMNHATPLDEPDAHLQTKLRLIATVIGKESLAAMGFSRRDDFLQSIILPMKHPLSA